MKIEIEQAFIDASLMNAIEWLIEMGASSTEILIRLTKDYPTEGTQGTTKGEKAVFIEMLIEVVTVGNDELEAKLRENDEKFEPVKDVIKDLGLID